MLFNSLQFLVFFGFVTCAYFALPHKIRWILLLLSSCYFYMAFVPEYILILFFTILIDFSAGHLIERSSGKSRKMWLILSIISNVGILAFYKYFNFLNLILSGILGLFDQTNPIPALKIILPIGLSFHTFQAMSYTIEVYRGNQKAEKHMGIYALYVMFYPQLVAGPIERPQNLLPQFRENHSTDYLRIRSGLMKMAWGFFKKVVIADRLAAVVDECYGNVDHHNGLTMWVAVIFYSFQIYCDFSGYSDIALGAARIMGFRLMTNFNAPYLAKSLNEFWKRWHISLSSWFKDYLYIPLGGSRGPWLQHVRNLLIIFCVSGLWHGANWTFVIWGLLHAVCLLAEMLAGKYFPQLKPPRPIRVLVTFLVVSLLWVFFRSQNSEQAFHVFAKLREISFSQSISLAMQTKELLFCILLLAGLMLKERFLKHISWDNSWRFYGLLGLLILTCYLFGIYDQKQFIYFQF
jgi:alginate O-acetyltransferase complex protein AlgI